ncbi:NADPH-dependent F420 reductase [Rubellimicrobium roseum]|uniref:Dinucleotide-binding enzyme n=1 Tax=Rubellimicrobium roseum TaxID=687525 RepID=A0A5C4NJ69_9RHOB|nr:NAD(P)-binding domain-containing protein [Rubellimicrobium roseum]TNC73106.1 dinucleotide-binding enzyme [Rubellimicrobium roseum]
MRIAVIGRGKVGQALGEGWRRAGHDVIYGTREPRGDREAPIAAAMAQADVVALAVPWGAVREVLAAAGDLSGKVMIDCTNPLAMAGGRLGLAPPTGSSGAEEVAALAPGAHVVKTLNQTGAENMADPHRYAAPPVMFAAAGDAEAKSTALGLVADLGFEALDAGPLAKAALLEAFAMLWIDQAFSHGQGRDFAFARLRTR